MLAHFFPWGTKRGRFLQVLEVLAKENINLSRIESIPDEPGNYAFFLDFERSDIEDKVEKTLVK